LAKQLEGRGVEIGALHLPLQVPAGVQVTYIDRMPVEELRQHYPELADQELTPVNLIGSAENLSALGDRSVDFVIANHLVEHMEDPIRALMEFYRVLRPQGLLFMAVPDARVTHDQRRAITSIEHLIEEHRRGESFTHTNRLAHYRDWVDNVENSGILPEYAVLTDAERDARVQFLMERDYSIHFHVWDHTGFIVFFRTACTEAQLDFQLVEVADTLPFGGNELIILARKEPTISQRARHRLRHRRRHTLRAMVKATPAGPLLVRTYRAIKRR
jgi:SAM-dependent methyltransferase